MSVFFIQWIFLTNSTRISIPSASAADPQTGESTSHHDQVATGPVPVSFRAMKSRHSNPKKEIPVDVDDGDSFAILVYIIINAG